MCRTKKKTIKMKTLAIFLVLLMIISVSASIFNVVFATGTGSIQVSGMTSIGTDGRAYYEALTNPGYEAGRIIGISTSQTEGFSGSDGDMGTMASDPGGNKYVYEDINIGTYTFQVEVKDGYTLNNVMVGSAGSSESTAAILTAVTGTTNQFTFNVTVSEGTTVTVNPSFSYNGGNSGQQGGNVQTSNIQIWIDGITGAGTDGAVIDSTVNPAITSYTGTGFTINRGLYHADYDIAISEGGTTIPAIRIEGQGIVSVTPAASVEANESNNFGASIEANEIDTNSNGYSIFSENADSNISVETMEGIGTGSLILDGGVNIKGSFGVLDHDIQIGSTTTRSTKGISASNVVIEYGKLTMYCSDTIFEGISEENKMNIDVITNGSLEANTSLTTGTALNNIGKLSVMCAGTADITYNGGCSLGSITKAVRYYDFVNFETTQVVEEMKDVVELTNLTDGTGTTAGHDGKYEMTTTSTSLHLKSLSKALYTLSFNMTDENGNIVEDTKVANGTVIVKTACGIGRGSDGRTCNDFKIEEGTLVTIELLPDYGYQFISGSINGAAITTAQEGVATYTFNMPANHLHLQALFTPCDDSIIIDNDEIVGASINNLEGQINGNAEFKVEVADDVDKEAFTEVAEGATIVGFSELSLNEVVLKGNETDSWKTGITDLEEPMTVSLKVSDEMATELEKGESVGVLRDHNGEISLLEATYNKDTNELEFATNGYSTYAIVYSATELSAKTQNTDIVDSAKTGDNVLIIAILTIILVIIANIIVIKRRKSVKNLKRK